MYIEVDAYAGENLIVSSNITLDIKEKIDHPIKDLLIYCYKDFSREWCKSFI